MGWERLKTDCSCTDRECSKNGGVVVELVDAVHELIPMDLYSGSDETAAPNNQVLVCVVDYARMSIIE